MVDVAEGKLVAGNRSSLLNSAHLTFVLQGRIDEDIGAHCAIDVFVSCIYTRAFGVSRNSLDAGYTFDVVFVSEVVL